MKNFQPGGLRNRKPDLGGRPQSDVNNYAPKKRFESNAPRFDSRDKKDVQLFKTTCTTCGAACEVPFRPDGTKPVLCRDCFAKKNAAPTNANNRDSFTKNERIGRVLDTNFGTPAKYEKPSADYAILVKQLAALETKVNQLLELVRASEVIIKALPDITPTPVTPIEETATPKKKRKPKIETPAVKKAAVKKKAQVAKKTAKKVVKKTAK